MDSEALKDVQEVQRWNNDVAEKGESVTGSPLTKDKIIERLADLEHQQWEKWSKSVASEMLDNTLSPFEIGQRMLQKHQKWLPNWVPYDELDESTKEFDREWARKVYAVFEEEKASAVWLLRQKVKKFKNNALKEKAEG